MDKHIGKQERIFISIPDIAMRTLELWSKNNGIAKTKLMEWAIRQMVENQEEEKKT